MQKEELSSLTQEGKEEVEKEEELLGTIGLSLQTGTLQWLSYTELDYADKWNVRDPAYYTERVTTKLQELLADGMIRTPLVAVRLCGQLPTSKPIVVSGHVRVRAVERMYAEFLDMWTAHFSKIPVLVINNVTEDQRQRLVLDHGSEIQLKEVEVYKEFRRLALQGKTGKPIANMLSRLFYQLASMAAREKFDQRVADLQKDGFFKIGNQVFTDIEDVPFQTWRGHLQYYERIMKSPLCVEKEWLDYHTGVEGAINMDRDIVQLTVKLAPDEAAKLIEERKAKKAGKKEARGRIWAAARLIQARSACRSRYYGIQLDACLGDAQAAIQLPDLEAELCKIEKAFDLDGERLWSVIDDIITEQ